MGWIEFWTWVNENQLAATVIGGLVVAALIALFARLPRVGPLVRKALRWIWSWHPVSARRYEQGLRWEEQSHFITLDVAKRDAAEQIAPTLLAVEDLHREVEQLKAVRGPKIDIEANRRAAMAGVKSSVQPTPLPAPEPRWKFLGTSTSDDVLNEVYRFKVVNLMPGSVVLNARMDNNPNTYGSFSFDDAAFWPDLSGEAEGEFTGEVVGTDESGHVTLVLSWFDENHAQQTKNWLIKPRPRPVKPDPWAERATSFRDDTPF